MSYEDEVYENHGEQAYEFWRSEMRIHGIECDAWHQLDREDQAAWEATAREVSRWEAIE